MSHHLLNRDDAPFSASVWQLIDSAVIGAAKSQLCVRRIVDIEGPYGLGVKFLPGLDKPTKEKTDFHGGGAAVSTSSAVPMGSILSSFTLPARDIAQYEATGVSFDATTAADAAIACAIEEDSLLLNGSSAVGTEGLLTAKGASSCKLHAWKEVGVAADDLIAAATRLDEAGFHGPYALALAPSLHNLLYRRYEYGTTEYDHVKTLVTDGIVKAPGLKEGGVLIATGKQFLSIAVGQDLMVGFIGPVLGGYDLSISESIALRVKEPGAICVLKSA